MTEAFAFEPGRLVRPLAATEELPPLLPSPFDEREPHPVARRAAEGLMETLRAGAGGWERALREPGGGKMFGVLVVADASGRVGQLAAFSGMLDGQWSVDGFAPPIFDAVVRGAVEPVEEARVKRIVRAWETARSSPEYAAARAKATESAERAEAARSALRARHAEQKRTRARRRQTATAEERAALDQLSRGDKAERRKLEAELEAERLGLETEVGRFERRVRALERLRRMTSAEAMRKLHDCYVIRSFDGSAVGLRELFGASIPPSGAGDCAAPKLFEAARRLGLRPIALAEFWWGAPPASGGRVEGAFYPSCERKCGPILRFMLRGLEVAPPRRFAAREGALDVVYEDPHLVVLAKPVGLLSIPGKDPQLKDSVLTRLRARYPEATGPLLAHRLDQDTSGLLIAGLDARSHARLQKQFLRREVEKRYVALVDRHIAEAAGTIDFAIRVDPEERPRQIPDPVHGKRAVTEWRVLGHGPTTGQTRIAFFPKTGRTHQLRVHAAHPLGLGAPIVGDRLYGRGGARLMLHAERIAFAHPATGAWVSFEWPAPF